MKYQPPYTITPEILNRVAVISEAIGRLTVLTDQARVLRLRRINRIRSIHGSLAIEVNTLSEAQITAILKGKRVIHMAPPADRVPQQMADLLGRLAATDAHPLIASSVFHNEFEFIHPFADGNGRMRRLWQSLILARWKPLSADIPVESLIFKHQTEYYQALQECTQQTYSAPFITFMLRMILDTVTTSTPEATPEARLLSVLTGEMTRQQLKEALGLKDDKHFRKAYLLPALEAGLIEMTIPDKPRSSKQKYRFTDKGRQWLAQRLSEDVPTIVGIDHGFSFPLRYFEVHHLEPDWTIFLNDFQKHWPTDAEYTYVDFIRHGSRGDGEARSGSARWRRITEEWAGAKSVFHFDVPGSVAKSTHAGLPWLGCLGFSRLGAGFR